MYQDLVSLALFLHVATAPFGPIEASYEHGTVSIKVAQMDGFKQAT